MGVFLRKLTLAVVIGISVSQAHAYPALCRVAHRYVKFGGLVEAPPFEQMRLWEIEENIEKYLKPRGSFAAPYSVVPAENFDVTFTLPAPQALKEFIFSGNDVRLYKHPFNKSSSVPYFAEPEAGSVMMGPMASRSMAKEIGSLPYTIKMATNRPHGDFGPADAEKANMQEDLVDGLHRMHYLNRVESEIDPDPDLILAKEVAFVIDKATGQGYSIRDYSFMKEGHFYLPALALPYVGRKIAEHNGWNHNEFWKRHYAKVLGRLKARFLLRYGLQMETPNPQNILIELDDNLKPTGRLVFRDLSDTVFVKFIAESLGEAETLASDEKAGVVNRIFIRPKWVDSHYHFNEAPEPYKQMTLLDWGGVHDDAFKKELEAVLGVDLSRLRSVNDSEKLGDLLETDQVKQRLRDYRQSLREAHQAKTQVQSQP